MPKIVAGKSILLVLGIALAFTLTVTVFVHVNEVQARPTTTPPEDGRSHGCATGLGEKEEEIVKAWWAKVLQ
jgi:hypothetical protein